MSSCLFGNVTLTVANQIYGPEGRVDTSRVAQAGPGTVCHLT